MTILLKTNLIKQRERERETRIEKEFTPERERESNSGFNWKSPYLIGGGVALLLGIGLIIYFLTRKKPKEDDES